MNVIESYNGIVYDIIVEQQFEKRKTMPGEAVYNYYSTYRTYVYCDGEKVATIPLNLSKHVSSIEYIQDVRDLLYTYRELRLSEDGVYRIEIAPGDVKSLQRVLAKMNAILQSVDRRMSIQITKTIDATTYEAGLRYNLS